MLLNRLQVRDTPFSGLNEGELIGEARLKLSSKRQVDIFRERKSLLE